MAKNSFFRKTAKNVTFASFSLITLSLGRDMYEYKKRLKTFNTTDNPIMKIDYGGSEISKVNKFINERGQISAICKTIKPPWLYLNRAIGQIYGQTIPQKFECGKNFQY